MQRMTKRDYAMISCELAAGGCYTSNYPGCAGDLRLVFQFKEKCRWVSPENNDGDFLAAKSAFPVEMREYRDLICRFISPRTAEIQVRKMLREMCVDGESLEFFAGEVSSFASEMARAAVLKNMKQLVISAELKAVTVICDGRGPVQTFHGSDGTVRVSPSLRASDEHCDDCACELCSFDLSVDIM